MLDMMALAGYNIRIYLNGLCSELSANDIKRRSLDKKIIQHCHVITLPENVRFFRTMSLLTMFLISLNFWPVHTTFGHLAGSVSSSSHRLSFCARFMQNLIVFVYL